MYVNLGGLNILVTGATGTIGKSLASKLAEAGATVAVHYFKNSREAENLSHVLGNDSRAFYADLSKSSDTHDLFDKVIMKYGSIEVFVHCASLMVATNFDSSEKEWTSLWDDTHAVNVRSSAILSDRIIKHALSRKRTVRIINVISRAAQQGEHSDYLAYSSSKGALASLTKSIAANYGRHNITAFNVAPGFVRGDVARSFNDQYGEGYADSDIAMSRLTEARDVAPLITFLSSGMADHATGSTFDINAGSCIR